VHEGQLHVQWLFGASAVGATHCNRCHATFGTNLHELCACVGLQDTAQELQVSSNMADATPAPATAAQPQQPLLAGLAQNGNKGCSQLSMQASTTTTAPGAFSLGHAMSNQQPGSMANAVNALRALSVSSGVAADVSHRGGHGGFPPVAVVFVAVEGIEGRQQARDPSIE
jgi:hypothetical protein